MIKLLILYTFYKIYSDIQKINHMDPVVQFKTKFGVYSRPYEDKKLFDFKGCLSKSFCTTIFYTTFVCVKFVECKYSSIFISLYYVVK